MLLFGHQCGEGEGLLGMGGGGPWGLFSMQSKYIWIDLEVETTPFDN